jgi:hypothetical protein
MDPNACLQLVIDHIVDGDFEEAAHSLSDLNQWVSRGGFLPRFAGDKEPFTKAEYIAVYTAFQLVISAGEASVDKGLEAREELIEGLSPLVTEAWKAGQHAHRATIALSAHMTELRKELREEQDGD